jgi:hypothetical protein
VGLWEFANREFANREQAQQQAEQAQAGWDQTLAELDAWPLIPVCADPAADAAHKLLGGGEPQGAPGQQYASVACRHSVLCMPQGESERTDALRGALIKLQVLVMDPKFAATGLFREELVHGGGAAAPFAEQVIHKIGVGLGALHGPGAAAPLCSAADAEVLLHFFKEAIDDEDVAISDAHLAVPHRERGHSSLA